MKDCSAYTEDNGIVSEILVAGVKYLCFLSGMTRILVTVAIPESIFPLIVQARSLGV